MATQAQILMAMVSFSNNSFSFGFNNILNNKPKCWEIKNQQHKEVDIYKNHKR